jgi:hypothetical protein
MGIETFLSSGQRVRKRILAQETTIMMNQETGFLKAYEVFQKICEFLESARRDDLRLDEVERVVQTYLAEQGLAFLKEYVADAGDGDAGETVTNEDRVLQRSQRPHKRRYVSIFGELEIPRYVYSAGDKKAIEYAPLDARLGLPAGETSYVLEDYQERLCVKSPFAKGGEDLKAILGTAVSVATAEAMNRQMAGYAQGYRLSGLTEEQTPPRKKEGELLVVAADGKGVPMRRTLEQRLQEERSGIAASTEVSTDSPLGRHPPGTERRRQGVSRKSKRHRRRGLEAEDADEAKTPRGRRKGSKQMAYVGAVYTIDRFRRTADDVLDEIARRKRQTERPRPQHKHVWGEMTQLNEGQRIDGRSLLFVDLAVECHYRDPDRTKTLICLIDGEEPLWAAQAEWLGWAVPILDFFHVLEHLWKLASVLYEGRAAEAFVEHHARMFLEGKVAYAIRNFGRFLQNLNPRSKKAAEVKRAIGYFRHNRDRMHYDEYLAQGYPIGSGAAEGTCRNLVKDRLELAGMKWEHTGAQAMIYLRALYLNDEWNEFIDYRVEKEQERLYGKDTIYERLAPYGQAV